MTERSLVDDVVEILEAVDIGLWGLTDDERLPRDVREFLADLNAQVGIVETVLLIGRPVSLIRIS